MALINCKECGNQISDTAKSCPQCGAKVTASSGCGTIIVLCILGLFVLVLIGNYSGGSNQSSSSNSSTYESYQQSSEPAALLTKQCASEAGMPANDPQHKITPDEMSRFTACIDRNK